MKRIILIALFFLLCQSSFAQRIHFCNPTNVWSTLDSTLGCCIPIARAYRYISYDSTTFNYSGNTYLYQKGFVANVLVREDANKVYVLGNADSIERVLYDFTLGVNDTMRTVYPQDVYVAWVTQMDSTELAGQWYKVWHFDGVDTNKYYADSVRPFTYNVIEGIGCTNGPYYPASPYTLASFSSVLLCFHNDMGITSGLSNPVNYYASAYTGHYDNDSSCTDFSNNYVPPPPPIILPTEGITQHAQNNNNVIVVPDPVTSGSRLLLPYNMQSGKVVILNSIGQAISTISFQNKSEVTIGDQVKTPGIYYYRLTDSRTGQTFSGKFIYR